MRSFTDLLVDSVLFVLGRRKTLNTTLSLFTKISAELSRHLGDFDNTISDASAKIAALQAEIEATKADRTRATNALNQINTITGDGVLTAAELKLVA